MPKRKRLSEVSPLKQTPQNGEVQSPKTRTRQSLNTNSPRSPKRTPQLKTPNAASNGKQTLHSQNLAVKSPKVTPETKQNAPKDEKKMPLEDDDAEESDNEILLNLNGFKKSTQVISDENEGPGSKRLKKNGPSDEDCCDAKTLFVKNLPAKYTVTQVKALSKDILDVRLRAFQRFGKGSGENLQHLRYAFLEFESESKAELNYKRLQGKKLDNKELNVDYVGAKSTHKTVTDTQQVVQYNKKRLYVAGLSQEVTKADLEQLFPTSCEVVVPKTRKLQQMFGYAFINFEDEADCITAHDEMQNKTLKGNQLIVLYSKSSHKRTDELEKKNEKQGQADEEESDDEDDSEDDEDEEEEMDDEDGDDSDDDIEKDEDDSEDDEKDEDDSEEDE